MEEDPRRIEAIFRTRVLRLNALATGLTTGLTAGAGLFLATNWLVLKGGPVVGPHLALLGEFFVGYRVTFAGSLVGFAYAAVVGFVTGYGVGWLYNRLVGWRAGPDR